MYLLRKNNVKIRSISENVNRHLYENTNIQDFFASCTHVLSRLYRRFGFSIIKKDVLLPRTEKNYTLIRGNACEIFKYLSVEKTSKSLN